jgi:aconitate hydratase
MGVAPLEFLPGQNAASLGLTGRESFDLALTALEPRGELPVMATADDGTVRSFSVRVRIDTPEELVAYKHGGIMPYVVRQLLKG